MDLNTINLAALNSATKYPQILTYHGLDPKNGKLIEDQPTEYEDDVILTEKVDGTNARIVRFPDGDYVIGSREDLLYAKGDRILNQTQSIVPALKELADGLAGDPLGGTDWLTVFFLEVYGGRVSDASKQYTGSQTLGYRMFDVAAVSLAVLERPVDQVSTWRKNGGQKFYNESALWRTSEAEGIPLVPRVGTVKAEVLPTSLEGMYQWLKDGLPTTGVALDDGAKGQAEGIVLRSKNRSVISKARFQDYRRILEPQPQRRKK